MAKVKRISTGIIGHSSMRAYQIIPLGWFVTVYYGNHAVGVNLNDLVVIKEIQEIL